MIQEISKNHPGKPIWNILQRIKGVGPKRADSICFPLGITKKTKCSDLPENKRDLLDQKLSTWKKVPGVFNIEEALEKQKKETIKRWIQINAYKGRRHKLRFPARGQRTKSNANTAKKMNRPH